MPWDLDNNRPIYLQLMEKIQQDIISGVYHAGDRLPLFESWHLKHPSIQTRCKKHCPNWNEMGLYIRSVPAVDLLRRIKQC